MNEDSGSPSSDATVDAPADGSGTSDTGTRDVAVGSDTGSSADTGGGADTGPGVDATSVDGGSGDGSSGDASSGDATTADSSSGDDGGAEAATGDDGGTDATAADASGDDSSAPDAGPDDAGADVEVDAAGPPAVLLAKWNFDEGTGTTAADSSGNGNGVFFVGGAAWGPGKEGTGLVLDGNTAAADKGGTLFDTASSYSIVGWMNLQQLNAWQFLASEDDPYGSVFGLKLRGDNTNTFDFDFETTDAPAPLFDIAKSVTVATTGTWYHLAGVYQKEGASTIKLYVNGVLETTTPTPHPEISASGHFLIGRGRYDGVNGSWLKGTIDEVAVYTGVLTDAQVAAIYAAQK